MPILGAKWPTYRNTMCPVAKGAEVNCDYETLIKAQQCNKMTVYYAYLKMSSLNRREMF